MYYLAARCGTACSLLCSRRLSAIWHMKDIDIARFIDRSERVLAPLHALLPAPPPEPDWKALAFRWRKRGSRGYLQSVAHPHLSRVDDLVAIDEQKRVI